LVQCKLRCLHNIISIEIFKIITVVVNGLLGYTVMDDIKNTLIISFQIIQAFFQAMLILIQFDLCQYKIIKSFSSVEALLWLRELYGCDVANGFFQRRGKFPRISIGSEYYWQE